MRLAGLGLGTFAHPSTSFYALPPSLTSGFHLLQSRSQRVVCNVVVESFPCSNEVEMEKLKLEEMTCREAVKHVARMYGPRYFALRTMCPAVGHHWSSATRCWVVGCLVYGTVSTM